MASSRVDVRNPDDLEKFARDILRLSNQLDETARALAVGLDRLAEGWNDPVYSRFAANFKTVLKPISTATSTARDFVPELHRRVAALREFQR